MNIQSTNAEVDHLNMLFSHKNTMVSPQKWVIVPILPKGSISYDNKKPR